MLIFVIEPAVKHVYSAALGHHAVIVPFKIRHTVYYKNEILREGYVQLEIMNEQHGCSFEFYNLSNLEIFLNESVGIALNGIINGISGEFEVGEGRMISTSPSSQRELYIGAQEIVLEGEKLNVEYTFDSDSSEMVVKGNPNKARLENIDIMEGWVQFFLTVSAQ